MPAHTPGDRTPTVGWSTPMAMVPETPETPEPQDAEAQDVARPKAPQGLADFCRDLLLYSYQRERQVPIPTHKER